MEFKVIISDGGKTYQKEIKGDEAARLVGLRIGEVFDGGLIGESGQLQITGGTDKDGFPMRRGIPGSRRMKILVRGGPGFIPKRSGERKKKQVRGDAVSEAIVQINTKMIPKEMKPEKEEIERIEIKEEKEVKVEKEKKEVKREKEPKKVKEEEEIEEEERALPLTRVRGIGKKTADQLAAAGISSVQEFLRADIARLAKNTGLSTTQIEKLKESAQELMG